MAHFRDHCILCDENLYFGHIHSRFQSLARNHCLKFCNHGHDPVPFQSRPEDFREDGT